MKRYRFAIALALIAITVLGARALHPGSRSHSHAAPRPPVTSQPAAPPAPPPSPSATTTSGPSPNSGPTPSPQAAAAPAPSVDTSVYLIDCADLAGVEPDGYVLSCADGTQGLSGMTWSTWTASGATRSGQYYASSGGAKRYTNVTVTASSPVGGQRPYFTAMQVTGPGVSVQCTSYATSDGMSCS